MILELVGVAVVAFSAGFLVARRKYRRRVAATAGLVLPPPLNEEQYEKARGFYIEMYRASMQQYDKLVPWAAGGALVLSTTLLHDVAMQSASLLTRGLLGASWLFLFSALVSCIVGHFSSSRVYSSARAALDLRHNPKATDADKLEAADHDRIANWNNRFAYWSNYVGGGTLILGLGLLSAWAFLSLFNKELLS